MKKIFVFIALYLITGLLVPFSQAKEPEQGDNDNMQVAIVYSEMTDPGIEDSQPSKDRPIVWFVHGIKFFRTEFRSERRTLYKIYPDTEGADSNGVPMIRWESPMLISKRKWKEAVRKADDCSQYLAEAIKQMTPEKQKRLILAGHSLGARIVVRTAAKLLEINRNKKDNAKINIRKIILAGAAIDNDDKDIAATYQISMEPVDNIINTQDISLAFYCWIGEDHAALGTGYKSKDFTEKEFCEFVVHKSISHCKYFKVYQELHNCFMYEIVAPQVRPNLNWKIMNKRIWWNIVDECHGWELQKNLATNRYRIVDNENRRRSWGHWADEEEMIEVFDIIKDRLVKHKGESRMPKDWWKLVNPIQEYFNINSRKSPNSRWWKTLEEYKGWKLQITKSSEKYKLPSGDPRLADCLSKKRAYYKAKLEYERKIYEYKVLKKERSREINKVQYTAKEDEVQKKFNKLKDELEKTMKEKKKVYKEKWREYRKVKKYDKTECRILAPDNRRRAQGCETYMRQSFEDVKKQIDVLFRKYSTSDK